MTSSELRSKRLAAEISATVLAANARINRSRLSNIERRYVQATNEELQHLVATLDSLIEAKSAVDRVADSWDGRLEFVMTSDQLTAILVERVLGWKTCPDRFVKTERSWTPRSRFRPFDRLEDAFLLLDTARAVYNLSGSAGVFTARVRIGRGVGKASGEPKARTITLALSQALGIGADGQ